MRRISLFGFVVLGLLVHRCVCGQVQRGAIGESEQERFAAAVQSGLNDVHDECAADGGLTISSDGVVTASSLLNDMYGFAKLAGTTGGLGQKLLQVTDATDSTVDGKHPSPGTLRYAEGLGADVASLAL